MSAQILPSSVMGKVAMAFSSFRPPRLTYRSAWPRTSTAASSATGVPGLSERCPSTNTSLFPALYGLLREDGEIACLIKPQFEAGREKVGKKGVVRDPKVHLEVLEGFLVHAKENNFTVLGITYSPIRGPEGNIEYLGYLKKNGGADCIPDLRALVDASHSDLKEAHGEA